MSFTGANMKLPRPIWVYKKDSNIVEETHARKKTAGNLIAKHYDTIWKTMNYL